MSAIVSVRDCNHPGCGHPEIKHETASYGGDYRACLEPGCSCRQFQAHLMTSTAHLMTSAVDHPSHYGGANNVYEAIKVIEAWRLGFNLGNAVKYIARAGKKVTTFSDKMSEVEDLKKAVWYLSRHIASLESALTHSNACTCDICSKFKDK